MIANIIVGVCTVLMVGAIIWVLIAEHNSPDETADTEKKEVKEGKKDE